MKFIEKKEDSARSISAVEALAIVESIRAERGMETNEAFQSILKYLRVCPFARNPSWAERVRRILLTGGLTEYEASLVINLMPERHIDAKALISSLSRVDNYTLDSLLNEIGDVSMN